METIYGIGVDIVNIARIEQVIQRLVPEADVTVHPEPNLDPKILSQP